MVVGAESESYRTLRYLVQRLPAMIAPAWLKTPTQPIAATTRSPTSRPRPRYPDPPAARSRSAARTFSPTGRCSTGWPSRSDSRPRPKLPVPLLTPWLSSHWIGLVTPVDAGVARPLVEGLSTETVVTDPAGAALFDVEPIGFDDALRRTLAEERSLYP